MLTCWFSEVWKRNKKFDFKQTVTARATATITTTANTIITIKHGE